MNKEEPYRDQAERLRQKIEKYNESDLEESPLPPRSELHNRKKTTTKWRLKYPLIRLLVLFFILLPITIFSIYSYIGSKHIGTEKVSVPSKGYETINFKKSKSEKINNTIQSNKENTSNPEQQKDENTADPSNNPSNSQQTQGSVNESKQGDNPQNAPQTNSPEAVNNIDKNVSNQAEPATSQPSTAQTQVQPTPLPNNTATEKIVYHTVQPHETLYRIAMKYYQSKTGVETIKTANHLHTNSISTGQVLKIPLKK